MAMYHLSVKYVSRNQGKSAVGAAAYRAGEHLYNERDGVTHDYTNKRGIIYSEIMLPENAPTAFSNRQTLWNAVERAEVRRDARTAREVEIALPNELSHREQIALVREYVQEHFVSQGMCADIAIHSGKHRHSSDPQHNDAGRDSIITPDNPHAHILLTTRPTDENGFTSKKNPDWNKRENVNIWREGWANAQNKEFERKGLETRVTHESFEKQGLDREPTLHMGAKATALERAGVSTEIGNINRAIRARNLQREEIRLRIQELQQEIIRLEQQRDQNPTNSTANDEKIQALRGKMLDWLNGLGREGQDKDRSR